MIALAIAALAAPAAAAGLQPPVTVASQFVPARTVQVWLPPGYAQGGRYPVLYAMDGQNVFDTPAALSGASWHLQRALDGEIAAVRARPAIIVAVWSNANRLGEYMPQAALDAATGDPLAALPVTRADVAGDAYLRFLAEELKPAIDRQYRTLAGRRDTFLIGSSMGGLIGAYAVTRYPRVFGGAACLSTAWQIGGGVAARWYAAHLPPRATRLYFDYGSGTEDGVIGPWQQWLAAVAQRSGRRWLVKDAPGDHHTESAWARRAPLAIDWLLGRQPARR